MGHLVQGGCGRQKRLPLISRVLCSLVDEWWRSFRRQKVGGCERVTRVAAAGLGREASNSSAIP